MTQWEVLGEKDQTGLDSEQQHLKIYKGTNTS